MIFSIRTEKIKIFKDVESMQSCIEKRIPEDCLLNGTLYECDIIIRGFNEKKLRAQNIWR